MSQVNSYGHGGTISSLKHTFFLGKLEQAVNQYFVLILSLVTEVGASDDNALPAHAFFTLCCKEVKKGSVLYLLIC